MPRDLTKVATSDGGYFRGFMYKCGWLASDNYPPYYYFWRKSMKRHLLKQKMVDNNDTMKMLAQVLDIAPNTLYRKMQGTEIGRASCRERA